MKFLRRPRERAVLFIHTTPLGSVVRAGVGSVDFTPGAGRGSGRHGQGQLCGSVRQDRTTSRVGRSNVKRQVPIAV